MVDLAVNGLISGLDINGIIDALVDSERAPIRRLEQRRTLQSTRLQALQNLSSRLLALQVAASRLGQSGSVSARRVNVSDTSILSATVSSAAVEGSYSLRVEQLARAQQFSSGSFAATDTALGLSGEFLINGRVIRVKETDTLADVARQINSVSAGVTASTIRVAEGDYRLIIASRSSGAGRVDLRNVGADSVLEQLTLTGATTAARNPIANGAAGQAFGSDSQAIGQLLGLSSPGSGSFQIDEGNGNLITVDVDLATATLADVAAAVNDAVAAFNAGDPPVASQIAAAVVEADGGFALQITGAAPPSFVDDGNVLETLGVLSRELTQEDQAGQNALIRLNNILIERNSNVISDVIAGVTLALADDSRPDSTVTLTVSEDTGVASEALSSLVSAYNQAREFISVNSAFNAETREAGIFLGDFTVRGIESELFRLVGQRVNVAIANRLADLNGGAGVERGSIVITNRAGVSATVDLSNATTLSGAVEAINRTTALKVTASLNEQGTGLQLVDQSGGNGRLRVEESGGRTATDLGLLGSTSGERLVGGAITEASWVSLADLGVRLTATGTLTFDAAQLTRFTSQNPEAVRVFLTHAAVGVGASFSASLEAMTATTSGTLKFRSDAIRATIDGINKSISRYEERIERYEARLVRQFTEMERALSGFTQTSDFLASQLAGLNNLRARR